MKASCSAVFCCFLRGVGDIGSKHRVLHVRVLRCRIEKPFENIGFDPAPVPIEYGISFAKQRRKIAPEGAMRRVFCDASLAQVARKFTR